MFCPHAAGAESFVAQILNLLYRAVSPNCIRQGTEMRIANPRYSRAQSCARNSPPQACARHFDMTLKSPQTSAKVASVNTPEHLDELMACRLDAERKAVEPCSIVIFGASGDLTARKLIPAFYHLYKEKQMPPDYRILGFARREKTDDSWR